MSKRTILRLISLAMFIVAVIFIFCALSNPALGKTIYIGSFRFGAEQKHLFYALYVILMDGLFIASFITKEKK